MPLQVQSIVLSPNGNYPFYIIAKRYAHPAFRTHHIAQADSHRRGNANRSVPLTLLLLHSTSFHKEIYEPILEMLFSLTAHSELRIREAWAVECPNHGESAVYNSDKLQTKPFDEYFSCAHYAEAVRHFLAAHDAGGASYIRPTDRLVGVGHSLGGCTAIILSERVSFASLLVIDPFLYPGSPEDLLKLRVSLVRQAHVRRDVWHSRKHAEIYLRETGAKGWDPRILKLYLNHGLREHPHASRSVAPYSGVVLACTREQEATMYRDEDGGVGPLKQLSVICEKIPVHIAFGAESDVIPRTVQDKITETRRFASIKWIERAGHLVPQQAPDEVAHFIYNALSKDDMPLARL